MSNARYFADGVDYWRVHYTLGNGNVLTEGPYISDVSARKVLKMNVNLANRQAEQGLTHNSYLLTGKIQKLVAEIDDSVEDEDGEVRSEAFLMWKDIDV